MAQIRQRVMCKGFTCRGLCAEGQSYARGYAFSHIFFFFGLCVVSARVEMRGSRLSGFGFYRGVGRILLGFYLGVLGEIIGGTCVCRQSFASNHTRNHATSTPTFPPQPLPPRASPPPVPPLYSPAPPQKSRTRRGSSSRLSRLGVSGGSDVGLGVFG